MFSIEFKRRERAGVRVLAPPADYAQAVSLGGIIDLPSEIDHAFRHVASGTGRPQELEESGVTDGLVRISVGVEDWRDLLADFEQALAAVAGR